MKRKREVYALSFLREKTDKFRNVPGRPVVFDSPSTTCVFQKFRPAKTPLRRSPCRAGFLPFFKSLRGVPNSPGWFCFWIEKFFTGGRCMSEAYGQAPCVLHCCSVKPARPCPKALRRQSLFFCVSTAVFSAGFQFFQEYWPPMLLFSLCKRSALAAGYAWLVLRSSYCYSRTVSFFAGSPPCSPFSQKIG